MITAYFDDSGTDAGSSVAVVGGYIGADAQWESFTTKWRKLLDEFGVPQMHRAELESFYGEFVGWNPSRRNIFVNKAQQIIKDKTYIGVGNSVIKADFEEVFPSILKKYYGGPYGYCALLCVTRARQWHEDKKITEPLEWVFEAGTEGESQFKTLMTTLYDIPDLRRDFRVGAWSFERKTVVPLQSADVLAYEMFKHVTNQIVGEGKNWKTRISFDHLIRLHDHDFLEHWPKDRLQEYVEGKVAQDFIRALADQGFR